MDERDATDGKIELTEDERERLDDGETVKITRGNRVYRFDKDE